jgi:hypothetical protein
VEINGLSPFGHSVKRPLNYMMMVERYQNLKEKVGGSNPGCEISSLPGGKLARWSTAYYALALACRHSVSRKKLLTNYKKVYISSIYKSGREQTYFLTCILILISFGVVAAGRWQSLSLRCLSMLKSNIGICSLI